MGLLEMYFWMILIISGFLNIPIVTMSEDLKNEKRFKKYLKISFFIGLFGIVMVSTSWNYLCGYLCLVFTFSPFITLLVIKAVMILSKRITKKEGFHLSKKKLSDGLFEKNKGDLKFMTYYDWYTSILVVTPAVVLMLTHILLEKTTC